MATISTPSKISLDIYDVKAEVTLPHSDLSAEEVVRNFCSLMITHTFYPESIITALREIADDLEQNFTIDKENENSNCE